MGQKGGEMRLESSSLKSFFVRAWTKSGVLAFLIVLPLILLSCGTSQTVPPAPTINLYLHFAKDRIALCARTDGTSCEALPIWETNNFIMLSPRDWQAVNDYIDLLILQIQDPKTRQLVVEEKRRIVNNFKR
jgi:hypothetical protein